MNTEQEITKIWEFIRQKDAEQAERIGSVTAMMEQILEELQRIQQQAPEETPVSKIKRMESQLESLKDKVFKMSAEYSSHHHLLSEKHQTQDGTWYTTKPQQP